MKFDIEIVLNNNGDECYLCIVRKRLIKATPEEKIRQEVLKFLIEEKMVPIEMICVEMRLDKYEIEATNDRADIIIEMEENINNSVTLKPIVVIECKSQDTALTYKTVEQVERYANKLGVSIYGMTNGINQDWYIWNEDQQEYLQIKALPTYLEILAQKGHDIVEHHPYFDTPQNVYDLSFPKKLIPFIDNLSNLFEDINFKMELPRAIGNITVIKDGGKRKESNTNPSGEPWVGYYRYFLLSNNKNELSSIGFKVYIRTDLAYLNISINEHHSLQLCLNNWIHLKGDVIEIWHDGTTTTGKGSAKRKDVIQFVQSVEPDLIKNQQIFLGSLNNSQKFSFENDDVLDFFDRLVRYVIARELFRKK